MAKIAPLGTQYERFEAAVRRMHVDKLFRITTAQRAELESALGVNTSQLLRLFMERGRHSARPQISRFLVGAAALGATGDIFVGVNVEFGGCHLGATLHAEQFLVLNAMGAGETRLIELATSSCPCGHCRQFLNELPRAAELVVHMGSAGRTTLGALLPFAFGPSDLFDDFDSHILSGKRHDLRLLSPQHQTAASTAPAAPAAPAATASVVGACGGGYGGGGGSGSDGDAALLAAAVEGACRSYAPYTKCPSGVAVRMKRAGGSSSSSSSSGGGDGDGDSGGDQAAAAAAAAAVMYVGWSVENCAYNPTVSPLQTALVQLIMGGRAYDEIEAVALVECRNTPAAVGQADVTRALLRQIAPAARLIVGAAEKTPALTPEYKPKEHTTAAILATPGRPTMFLPDLREQPPMLDLQAAPPPSPPLSPLLKGGGKGGGGGFAAAAAKFGKPPRSPGQRGIRCAPGDGGSASKRARVDLSLPPAAPIALKLD